MKIIVSQTDKKVSVIFEHGKIIDKYTIDKAENFLVCVDKFLTKHYTTSSDSLKNVKLEFNNTGVLTERVSRAIIGGLGFFHNKKIE